LAREDERLEFLGQVATWYYEDRLDQAEIAERIGKSRSMVSRLLDEARAKGLVEVRVRFPIRRNSELEDRLVEIFGLREARVLAGAQLHYDSLLRRVGRLGARALQSRIHSGMDVTIGWGAALHAVVSAMPEIRLDDVMVIQAMGSVGDGDPNVDGADLARTLASKIDGDFRTLHAPLIVDRGETAAALLADTTNSVTLRRAADAAVAISGIGSIDSQLSGLLRAGYFTNDHLRDLRSRGVVGDVMGYLIDENGKIMHIPENDRIVALQPNASRKAETVIGVAAGNSKAAAVLGAVRGGYFDVLVTDEATADGVVALHIGRTTDAEVAR
jgi:DNA-binding transcriptional regulator LsrR (DeoR family)